MSGKEVAISDGEKNMLKNINTLLKKRIAGGGAVDQERFIDEIMLMLKYEGLFVQFYDIVLKALKENRVGTKNVRNSYVAYALGLTSKEPEGEFEPKLRFDLARVSHPDIDVDFDYFKRDNVYYYIIQKYGRERTGNIGTSIGFKPKSAINKAIKALDPLDDRAKSLELEQYVSKEMDMDMTLADIDNHPTLKDVKRQFPECFRIAEGLEGIMAYSGVHPAGIVVSDDPIKMVAPLHRIREDEYATQFEQNELEDSGLIKFDILSLKTLSVLDMAVKDIYNDLGLEIDIDNIDIGDKEALRVIANCETESVFQLEGYGMKKLLEQIGIENFRDVAAANALFRPGALAAGAHDEYCACKNGEKKVTYEHPILESILDETYGQLIYQEQCQLITRLFAGFSIKEADMLRKAIGKKKGDLFVDLKKKFLIGARKNTNASESVINSIWQKIEDMGGYGFCKAHAFAYAFLAMQCAYLKGRFPIHYMKAVLNSEVTDGKLDKAERYMDECLRMGIKILPCNVNKSKSIFTIEGKALRSPLSVLKGVGHIAAEAIEKHTPYKDFEEFISKNLKESSVNKSVVEVLILEGVFADLNVVGEEGVELFNGKKKELLTRQRKGLQTSKMFGQRKPNDRTQKQSQKSSKKPKVRF